VKIVFQVEEEILLSENNTISKDEMDRIAMILTNFSNSEKHVILVTAGAIAAGAYKLGKSDFGQSLTEKQALSAIGQVELIKQYQNIFDQYNQMVAQVLLARNIIEEESHRINAHNTFLKLIEMNIIPVINENDCVSSEDIVQENNTPLTEAVAEIAQSYWIVSFCKDHSFDVINLSTKEKFKIDNKVLLFDFFDNRCHTL